MSPRPRPTFALALATASALAAPTPGGTAAFGDEPTAEQCYIYAISDEEAAAGAVSEVECLPVGEEPSSARSADIDLAVVFTAAGGLGTSYIVRDPSCTGGNVVFGAGSPWDNIISSTELLACGNAKHWDSSTFSGQNQLVSTSGTPVNMTAAPAGMDNKTSSIEYAP